MKKYITAEENFIIRMLKQMVPVFLQHLYKSKLNSFLSLLDDTKIQKRKFKEI